MIVTRYNFETNSSSMHSLSYRRSSGAYSIEELQHSESTANDEYHDAIFVMTEGEVTSTEEMKKQLWLREDDDSCSVSYYDVAFKNSAMEVLPDFRGRLMYALSSIYGRRTKGWERRIEEIEAILNKYLPGVKFSARGLDERVGTNDNLLYPFLRKNKISIEDFLLNDKYVVIVNTAEYQRMKFLNMVDESQIERVYAEPYEVETKMNIEDGVWKINGRDLQFGRYPYRVLGTVEGKARYALATYGSHNINEVLAILKEVYPELERVELPKCSWDKEKEERGYCEDSVLPLNVPLRDFILDKKYVVISDGDEYCVWDNFKKSGLFNWSEYPEESVSECDY